MKNNQNKIENYSIIRWILFIPAAFAAYYIMFYISTYLLAISLWLFEEDTPFNRLFGAYVNPIIAYCIRCYFFISAGRFVAPLKEKHISAILFALLVLVVLFSIMTIYLNLKQLPPIKLLIQWGIGLIVTYYTSLKMNED
jgi:hypothetical protein